MTLPLKQNNSNALNTPKPNFFIVGFPKCGTTTLYENLRQHPEVFMPWNDEEFWITKEPNFFDQDIEIKYQFSIRDEGSYFDLFRGATEKCIGESSTFYIYSEEAPNRIHQMNPDAKIIIMLRNPIDMIVSWHYDCYRWGHEDILDFEEALAAAEDRKNGLRVPRGCYYPQLLQYKEMGKYARHIARYIDIFGSSQVKFILLDDLKNQPLKVFQDVTQFLELHTSFIPDQANHNPSIKLSRIHQTTLGFWERFGKAKERLPILPESFWTFTGKVFHKVFLGFGTVEKSSIDGELRKQLVTYFQKDIQQVERLIGQDLSTWYL